MSPQGKALKEAVEAFVASDVSAIDKIADILVIDAYTRHIRSDLQKNAIEEAQRLGFLRSCKYRVDFVHHERSFKFMPERKRFWYDHIPAHVAKKKELDDIQKKAQESRLAQEAGLSLGPNDMPPATYSIDGMHLQLRTLRDVRVPPPRRKKAQ